MLDQLAVKSFSQRINQKFLVHIEGRDSLELELIEAVEMGAAPQNLQHRQTFSVLFVGPSQPMLPQRIYQVEHADIGTLGIFLVPLGPDRAGGMQYEAVFA